MTDERREPRGPGVPSPRGRGRAASEVDRAASEADRAASEGRDRETPAAGDRSAPAGLTSGTDRTGRVARVVEPDGLERELRRMVVLHRRTLAGRVAGSRRANRART